MRPIHKLALSAIGAMLFTAAAACAALTPAEKAAIKEGFALACPLEAMNPVVGFEFAAACPFQDKEVADALDGNPAPGITMVTGAPDAGAPMASVHKRTARGNLCIGHGKLRTRKPAAPTTVVAAMPYAPDASTPDTH